VVQSEVYVVAPSAATALFSQDSRVLVDSIFVAAVKMHASDIHVQSHECDVQIRFRINGVLTLFSYVSAEQGRRLLSRLKVLMGLDITQVRAPQDGGLRIQLNNQIIDIRSSFFPALYGEKVVIRLLDGCHNMLQLHSLPFGPAILQSLYAVARQDQGLFLVTGPTGAGKTTTLYALLQAIDRQARNVVTLEDPIEYRIEGVTQTQINAASSFTFAQGVRSLLRQDPDVALIGELRDVDTVNSAIEAALTGHLVLSSLHTGSASGVPIRLREMGIEPYLIAHALKGVLAQRLVHRLCDHCKRVRPLTGHEQQWVAQSGGTLESSYFSAGCAACRYTGVVGQLLVAELWQCNSSLVAHLLQDSKTTQIDFERAAIAAGMIPLMQVGLALVQEGSIAISELIDHEA